jgi:membrane protein YdbS with pleckstrin-like domain
LGGDPTQPGTAQILSAYNALRAFESDYDKAQGQLRAIASAWLLAGVGACGFLVNAEFANSWDHYQAAVARQIVIFVVALGVSALWRLDQKVYQRLLHTVSALGYHIETQYPCVPPTRRALYDMNRDITGELSLFYSLPFNLILAVGVLNAGAAAVLYTVSPAQNVPAGALSPGLAVLICLGILVLHAAYCVYANLQSRTWGVLAEFLGVA